jgi:uncharacterized tellurite resistance protein B-like protein
VNTETWHKILTLLTVVILADDRVYKEEVDTFVASAMKLNKSISPDMFLTPKMAFDWFVANREHIQKTVNSPGGASHINRLILSLKSLKGKKEVIQAMQAIARADDELHKTEELVISQAAKVWGLTQQGLR